jgi:hypothetical protein
MPVIAALDPTFPIRAINQDVLVDPFGTLSEVISGMREIADVGNMEQGGDSSSLHFFLDSSWQDNHPASFKSIFQLNGHCGWFDSHKDRNYSNLMDNVISSIYYYKYCIFHVRKKSQLCINHKPQGTHKTGMKCERMLSTSHSSILFVLYRPWAAFSLAMTG